MLCHIYELTFAASLVAQFCEESACRCRRRSTDREDPLEEEMATHSSILAWKTPWTEESGGLQAVGSQRVEGLSH